MRSGWRRVTLKFVFELSNKKLGAHATEPPVFAVSKYDGVVLANEYFDKRIASSRLDGYKLVNSDGWVYSTIHIDEGSISRNHFPYAGVVSPMYTTMRWIGRDDLASYFELLLTSDLAIRAYRDNAQGTVNRRRSVSWGTFSNLEFVVPSFQVQRRIVDLVSSVDSYIAALRQQADAARSARSAVLSELLSAVGDDWIQTTVGEVMSTSIGGIWGEDAGADELDVFVYRQTEFDDDGCLSMPSDAIRSVSRNQLKSRRLLAGDILLQKSAGTPNLPGRVVIVPPGIEENATCSNFLQLIRADATKCDSRFLFWELWLRHKSGGAFEFQRGTNIRNLDLKQYFAQSLQLPPLAEQQRIVEIVSSIDLAIQSTERAVADAKSLRSGLLSELLSGEHEIPESYDRLLGAA